MSGFIGLEELFVKLSFELGIILTPSQKQQIRKLLFPLSNKNVLTITRDDIEQALESFSPENQKIKKFLINYLEKNIRDMI